MSKRKFYITTAIDYVNAPPHIGTAYEKIGADVLARFKRLDGWDVLFVMGNDEHSLNVKKAADKAGLDPLSYCDRMDREFRKAWKNLDISFDDFIRTTEERHVKSVQKILKMMHDRGDIYPSEYEGWYCDSCESFITEKELVDGKCPHHLKEPVWIAEKNYFFALSKYREPLLDHIASHPEFIKPEIRRNEIVSLLKEGLDDISISRATRDWGIPFTFDPDQMIYVWFDALINYISAVGFAYNPKMFDRWWPADVHVIGKDITRFHCVIWPAMLLSAGVPLPETVFGHGFVYRRGERMSKTLGNIIDPLDVTGRFGPDPLRYYLMREGGWGRDSDFTWENFIERYNRDLANDLGNLLSRTIGMVHRFQNGTILAPGEIEEGDRELRDACLKESMHSIEGFNDYEDDLETHNILVGIWNIVRSANKYVDSQTPWVLNKEGKAERVATVLYNLTEALRFLSILLSPFIPSTSRKIWRQIGLEAVHDFDGESTEGVKTWGLYPAGNSVQQGEPLFPKIEAPAALKKSPVKATGRKASGQDPPKPETGARAPRETTETVESPTKAKGKKMDYIEYTDFQKIDLRSAKIVNAESVPDTDRLVRMDIDLGGETRQVVAGIGGRYAADQLKGMDIIIVANLKPRKIRGLLSHGMLLAVADGEELALLTPDRKMKSGLRVS